MKFGHNSQPGFSSNGLPAARQRVDYLLCLGRNARVRLTWFVADLARADRFSIAEIL